MRKAFVALVVIVALSGFGFADDGMDSDTVNNQINTILMADDGMDADTVDSHTGAIFMADDGMDADTV